MSGKTVQRSVYLPKDVFDRIQRLADERQEKVSKVMLQLLTERVRQIEGDDEAVIDETAVVTANAPTEKSQNDLRGLERMVAHCQLLLMQVIDASMSDEEADEAIAQAKADLELDYPVVN